MYVLKIGCFIFVNLQGAGTDETTLTRVMVSRGEIDMLDIRAEYKKLYQNSLHKEINVRILCWYKYFSTGSGHLPSFFELSSTWPPDPQVYSIMLSRDAKMY